MSLFCPKNACDYIWIYGKIDFLYFYRDFKKDKIANINKLKNL